MIEKLFLDAARANQPEELIFYFHESPVAEKIKLLRAENYFALQKMAEIGHDAAVDRLLAFATSEDKQKMAKALAQSAAKGGHNHLITIAFEIALRKEDLFAEAFQNAITRGHKSTVVFLWEEAHKQGHADKIQDVFTLGLELAAGHSRPDILNKLLVWGQAAKSKSGTKEGWYNSNILGRYCLAFNIAILKNYKEEARNLWHLAADQGELLQWEVYKPFREAAEQNNSKAAETLLSYCGNNLNLLQRAHMTIQTHLRYDLAEFPPLKALQKRGIKAGLREAFMVAQYRADHEIHSKPKGFIAHPGSVIVYKDGPYLSSLCFQYLKDGWLASTQSVTRAALTKKNLPKVLINHILGFIGKIVEIVALEAYQMSRTQATSSSHLTPTQAEQIANEPNAPSHDSSNELVSYKWRNMICSSNNLHKQHER